MSFLSAPLQTIFLKPRRKIGDITVSVVINENTTDNLTLTKQPIQRGAMITDHAYKEPTTFSTTVYFQENFLTSAEDQLKVSNPFSSKNGLAELYQKFLDLQNSREPFDITTPKRLYKNMLMTSLNLITDKNTEKCLALNVAFQEVIIVDISTVSVPRSQQRDPATTAATEKAGVKNAKSTLRATVDLVTTPLGL